MPEPAQTLSRDARLRPRAVLAAVLAACAAWSGCDEKGPDAFAPVIFGFEDTGAISGTVTSGGVGIPAMVSLSGPVSDTETTDAQGGFFFSDLAAGSYMLMATADGFDCEPTTASVSAGQTAQAAIVCTAVVLDGSVVGQVTVDGQPEAGVTVTLDGG
ncbi:MAG: carboxypeptidase-like regulatory domain-containing protein, partial [Gemmatimonadota bacterium]